MKFLENKKYTKTKTLGIIISIILAFLLIVSSLYINFIKELIYKNVYNNITELSEQTATQLNQAITNQKNFVNIIINSIDKGFFKTEEEVFERFKNDLEKYHFTRLVILDKDGNGKTSDGHIVSNYKNISEFFNQEDIYLSENRPSTVSTNQVNIYSKTFNFYGEKKVLFATINSEDYKDILSRRLFDGKGGTYLVNSEGIILIDSFDLIHKSNINLYDYLKNKYKIINKKDITNINKMKGDIQKQNVGTFNIKLANRTNFIHYEKVNVNNWYVITMATDNTIAKELTTFIALSLGLCLLLILIVIGISIYIYNYIQKQNQKLYKTAYIDKVTLLGNENYFKDNGEFFLKNSSNEKYVAVLNINKFQMLTKVYDYDFCNLILKSVGDLLTEILPSNNMVCHISRDIYIMAFNYQEKIEKLLKETISNIRNLKIKDVELNLSVTIGIYKVRKGDENINDVLDRAYMAHSKIKGLYNKNYYIFDEVLEKKILEAEKIESEMEEALNNNEFKILYQPKIYTKNEKLAGAEALVRWYKGDEVISPAKFIPLFEKNKFIIKLDLYVFEQVCKDMKKWQEKYIDVPIISVNVSKEHFVDENFIDEYVKITDKYGIDRRKIDLEITESATIDEDIDILKILNYIKKQGFIISIDDFGTGYSSLSMLQDMPFDILKIDKTFIDNANLKSDKNIINYIVLIAKRLGVKTIVEGVENKEQVDFIKKLKCYIIQGYYYSKPIEKSKFELYFCDNLK